MICDHAKTCGDCWTTQAMDRVRERAEKAEARVTVLEAALSPIAAQAKGYSIALSDEHRNGHCTIVLTTAQLRMARDLLTRDSHNEKTEGD